MIALSNKNTKSLDEHLDEHLSLIDMKNKCFQQMLDSSILLTIFKATGVSLGVSIGVGSVRFDSYTLLSVSGEENTERTLRVH